MVQLKFGLLVIATAGDREPLLGVRDISEVLCWRRGAGAALAHGQPDSVASS